jgi:glycosyltransferase involved in cell wall biosynthesis
MIRTVVHFTDSNEFSGAEQILLRILTGLDRRLWRPVLFHHGDPGLAPLLSAAREAGVELRTVPRVGKRADLPRLPGFVRAIRAERPAAFHAHQTWPLSCKFGILAAALARVPAVIATVQLFPEVRMSRSRALQHRILTACVDRFIAVSNEVREQLHLHFTIPDGKVRVVPNGIPISRYAAAAERRRPALPPGTEDRPLVLTAARLGRHKGHTYLIEAAKRLPRAAFLFVGEGPERAALEAQAREAGVGERVHFLGYRDDVPDLLAACDVFALPSLYEGLPLSVMEAMAAGKPVVASAIGGTDEAVVHGETGLLVPTRDPDALAEAIGACLSDREMARRFGEAGSKRARREFSAESMVQQITGLYDELLDKHEAPAAALLAPSGA